MMNALGSDDECSSGCESGWTLYLEDDDQMEDTSRSVGDDDDDEEEELSMSMLSDASSGPPHPHFLDHLLLLQSNNAQPNIKPSKLVVKRTSIKRKHKKKLQKNKHHHHHHHHHDYDDTASSPLFHFSMNNINHQTSTESSTLDYSQGFSATYFQERSSLQLQGFLQENEAHHNNQLM